MIYCLRGVRIGCRMHGACARLPSSHLFAISRERTENRRHRFRLQSCHCLLHSSKYSFRFTQKFFNKFCLVHYFLSINLPLLLMVNRRCDRYHCQIDASTFLSPIVAATRLPHSAKHRRKSSRSKDNPSRCRRRRCVEGKAFIMRQ